MLKWKYRQTWQLANPAKLYSCLATRDVRCPSSFAIPRFVCQPFDSVEPMPTGGILPSVEVRGMSDACPVRYFDIALWRAN